MVKFSLHLIIQRDWTLVNPPIGALFSLREHGMPCLVVFADHSATVIPLTPSSVYPCSYFAWHSHRDMMHFLGDFFSLLWASDCSPVSTTPTSSLSSCKFQEGFEVCMASSLSSAPSSMPSTTSTTAASPTKTQVHLISSLSPPLTYLTNPRTFSTSPTTPTWHRHCWLWHFPPLTFLCSKRETSPFSRRITHPISGSFGYVVPEVIKNTGRRVLAHQYDCFPTHTQAHYSLSAQP